MVKWKKDIFDDPIKIRYRGQYDYDGLLQLMRQFYFKHHFDLYETKFKYKVGGSGAEVDFKFEGDKEVTEYVKVYMVVEGKFFDVKRESVVIDGEQRIMTNGRIDFRITGAWELDYADRFAKDGKIKKKLEKWMQDTLDHDPEGIQFQDVKLVGKKYMEKTLNQYADEIKSFIGMETMV